MNEKVIILNIGDLIFQFFSYAFLLIIVLILVWFFRTNNKTKARIKSLEDKVEAIKNSEYRDK